MERPRDCLCNCCDRWETYSDSLEEQISHFQNLMEVFAGDGGKLKYKLPTEINGDRGYYLNEHGQKVIWEFYK